MVLLLNSKEDDKIGANENILEHSILSIFSLLSNKLCKYLILIIFNNNYGKKYISHQNSSALIDFHICLIDDLDSPHAGLLSLLEIVDPHLVGVTLSHQLLLFLLILGESEDLR